MGLKELITSPSLLLSKTYKCSLLCQGQELGEKFKSIMIIRLKFKNEREWVDYKRLFQ